MGEIQKNIVKRDKRNGVSRMFHAKNDKETIATWRLDLNRILHVFNVRFVTATRPPLTVPFQTELAMNTSVAVSDAHQDILTTQTIVSDVHRDVQNTQTIVFDVRHDVTNTHTVVSNTHVIVSELQQNVSDIHRTMVESREGTEGKIWLVITTTDGSSTSYLRPVHLGNHLRRRREFASDAKI